MRGSRRGLRRRGDSEGRGVLSILAVDGAEPPRGPRPVGRPSPRGQPCRPASGRHLSAAGGSPGRGVAARPPPLAALRRLAQSQRGSCTGGITSTSSGGLSSEALRAWGRLSSRLPFMAINRANSPLVGLGPVQSESPCPWLQWKSDEWWFQV